MGRPFTLATRISPGAFSSAEPSVEASPSQVCTRVMEELQPESTRAAVMKASSRSTDTCSMAALETSITRYKLMKPTSEVNSNCRHSDECL